MSCVSGRGEEAVKKGLLQSQQRHRCKSWGFSITKGYRGKSDELKQQAWKLYLTGMGFRAIGRMIGVSKVSVLNWVRAYGQQAKKVLAEQPKQKI